jgi:hypothetical protein
MRIEDMRLVYDSNYWANEWLLRAVERASDGQFTAVAPYGSLRGTLVHAMSAELDQSPGNLDILMFLWERGYVQNTSRNRLAITCT